MSCLVQVSAYKLTGEWETFAIFAAQSGAERPREGGFVARWLHPKGCDKQLCGKRIVPLGAAEVCLRCLGRGQSYK